MPKLSLAAVFRFVLMLAALFAAPVASYLADHPVAYSVIEFLGAFVALFLRSPLTPAEPEKK